MQMKRSQRDPQLQMLFLQSHLSDFAAVIFFYRPFFPCLIFFYFPVSVTFFLTCAVLIFPFLFPSSTFSLLAGSVTNHSHVERSQLFC